MKEEYIMKNEAPKIKEVEIRFDRLFVFEKWVCATIIWPLGLCYALYSAYLASVDFSIKNPEQSNATAGWYLNLKVDRRKDWFICLIIIKESCHWWFVHLVGAELIRKHCSQFLSAWYLFIGLTFIIYTVGMAPTFVFLGYVTSIFILMHLRSRLLLWAFSLGATFWFFLELVYFSFSMIGGELFYPLSSFMFIKHGWMFMLCLSFSLDHIDKNKTPTLKDLLNLMAYNFYLPLSVSGPVIMYKEFETGMNKPYQPWTVQRLACFCLNILRYLALAVFTDVMMHYVHFNSLLEHPQAMYDLSSWSLFGLCYFLLLSFNLTYIVQYGLSSVIARAEQISCPPHPICIAHLQLGTPIWRHFDRGLYFFMVKYIYVPCLGNYKGFGIKFFASSVNFVFIYIFHGRSDHILLWTVVNFIEITLEGVAKSVGSTQVYQQWEKRWLSPSNARRLTLLLRLPLFIMTALPNMYFMGDSMEVGKPFTARLLSLDWLGWLTLVGLSYSLSHTTNVFYKCRNG